MQLLISKNKFPFILIALIVVEHSSSAAQTQSCTNTYTIKRHEQPVGMLTTCCESVNGTTTYTLTGTSNVQLLIHLSIRTLLQEVMIGKKLVSYKTVQHINDHVRMNRFGLFFGDVHDFRNGDTHTRTSTGPVYSTVATLYFREPIDLQFVFSEAEQGFVPVKAMGDHTYQLIFKDAGKTTYSYLEGRCVKVHAETRWSDVEFQMMPTKSELSN